jgi:hypothetical protein
MVEPIEGAGNSRTTQTYEFVDQAVEEGATYFYKLEQVSFDGTTEMYDPVTVIAGKTKTVQANTWGSIKVLVK